MKTLSQPRGPTGPESRSPAAELAHCKRALPTARPLLLAFAAMSCALLTAMPFAARAQSSVVYSNDFEVYSTGSYPFPDSPLPGWNAMPSGYGLIPSIVPKTGGSGQALEMNGYGSGGFAWMLVSSNLPAGSTSDWTLSAESKWVGTDNSTPYYGLGGLLLSASATGIGGDYLFIGYNRGDYDGSGNAWARALMVWTLNGVYGDAVVGSPAFRDLVAGGFTGLSASRAGGSGTISISFTSPTDGPVIGGYTFTGAQAAALDNLQYVGFMNYFSKWEYDNLVVTTQQGTPVISVSVPATNTVLLGERATFTASVSPSQVSTAQQWRSNGVPIVGGTNLTYTTPPTTLAYNGTQYSITVTNLLNPANVVTSSASTLVIRDKPGILPLHFEEAGLAPGEKKDGPLASIPGGALLAGDTVVLDLLMITNAPQTAGGDGWGAVNLGPGGFMGLTGARLGVLIRMGNLGRDAMWTNAVQGPEPAPQGGVVNRCRIELYPSATGSTTNMGWKVQIDPNLTGTLLPSVTGSNLTFFGCIAELMGNAG